MQDWTTSQTKFGEEGTETAIRDLTGRCELDFHPASHLPFESVSADTVRQRSVCPAVQSALRVSACFERPVRETSCFDKQNPDDKTADGAQTVMIFFPIEIPEFLNPVSKATRYWK
eukprot:m.240657 g.240657  ORF g.240657 m.240657 type:complete len:116 (+) comp54408_c0_seq8:406-753(+)